MRNRDVERLLKKKSDQAPVPEMHFRAVSDSGGIPDAYIGMPEDLRPARSRHALFAAGAAAAVVVCGAALALWRLPDALPVLQGGMEETSVTGQSVETPETTASKSTDETKKTPFPDMEEVPGYEAYKAALIENSGIADSVTDYQPDEKAFILTYKAVECHMLGLQKDAFVVYMIAQRSAESDGRQYIPYDYFMIYVLLSDGEPIAYMPSQELMETAYGTLRIDAVDFDGDGLDEVFLSSSWGGIGGSSFLAVYRFDGQSFIKLPIGRDSRPYSLEASVEPEGYYVIHSADTGYQERFRSDEWNWPISDDDTRIIWDETERDGIHPDTVVNHAVTDLNGDGIYEICIVNAYFHYGHSGRCGHGIEVFQYTPGTGCFQSVWTAYFREEDSDTASDENLYGDLEALVRSII